MYIERQLQNEALRACKQYPVVMVCGQRQVGKSTMLYHIKESDRKYVTFDDLSVRRLADTQYPVELFCDEQRVLAGYFSVRTKITRFCP